MKANKYFPFEFLITLKLNACIELVYFIFPYWLLSYIVK